MYTQDKITSIVSYKNAPYFYDSDATVFMYFLNTNTVSGYPMIPCCQGGIIQ